MHSARSVITHPLRLEGVCCSAAFPSPGGPSSQLCLVFPSSHWVVGVSQFWPSYRLSHFLFCPWGSDNASSLLDCGFNEAKSALCLLIGYLQDSRNNSKVRSYGFWIHCFWLLALWAGYGHPERLTIPQLTWHSGPSVCWLNNHLLDRPTHHWGSWCLRDWVSWTASGLGPIFPDHKKRKKKKKKNFTGLWMSFVESL